MKTNLLFVFILLIFNTLKSQSINVIIWSDHAIIDENHLDPPHTAGADYAQNIALPTQALLAIEELEAEVARLRLLVPRPDQTQDELVWRDHMRGVPLAALAKEFGCTKERMRHRLKKIAENKLQLTGGKDE